MSFLKLPPRPMPAAPPGYEKLGYLRNPFPARGEVVREIYVERSELTEMQDALGRFLQDPEGSGGFWAVAGDAGLGKSNCLQNIDFELSTARENGNFADVVSRYVGNQPISSRNLVEQLLQAVGSDRLTRLLERRRPAPPSLRDTDLGRFLQRFSEDKSLSIQEGAQFMMRWLGGNQTYIEERDKYGLWSRDHMLPAVAFPYLRDLIDMLAAESLLTRIVFLIDEFEDVQRLPEATQRDYVNSLKSLVNVFNWKRLFLIISGQETVFTTIEGRYTSIRDRWKKVKLLPLQEAQAAVDLANSYKQYARARFLATGPASSRLLEQLEPSDSEIQIRFANLLKRGVLGVKQRDLLDTLHSWVEERVK